MRLYSSGALLTWVLAAAGCDYEWVVQWVDRNYNTVSENPKNHGETDPDIAAFHKTLRVVDLHADTLPWVTGKDTNLDRLLERHNDRHVDVPRLIEGSVHLQVFSVPTRGSADPAPRIRAHTDTTTLIDGKTYAEAHKHLRSDPIAITVKAGGWPCETWFGEGNDRIMEGASCPGHDLADTFLERKIYAAELLARGAELSQPGNKLVPIRSLDDLAVYEEQNTGGQVAGLLALEGVYTPAKFDENGDLYPRDFNRLYNVGYRMMALVHFLDSDFAGSSTGLLKDDDPANSGVTAAGEALFELMAEHGVVIDVAHLSHEGIRQVSAWARRNATPVVHSHGGIRDVPWGEGHVCHTPRNLSDEDVEQIALTGGVVGIGLATNFVCGDAVSYTARAMRHAADLIDDLGMIGSRHIALGSDYDGLVEVHVDAANLDKLTEALLCVYDPSDPKKEDCLHDESGTPRPFSQNEVRHIMGENSLRVFKEVLPQESITLPAD